MDSKDASNKLFISLEDIPLTYGLFRKYKQLIKRKPDTSVTGFKLKRS